MACLPESCQGEEGDWTELKYGCPLVRLQFKKTNSGALIGQWPEKGDCTLSTLETVCSGGQVCHRRAWTRVETGVFSVRISVTC